MHIKPIKLFEDKTKLIGKLGNNNILGYLTLFNYGDKEGYAYLVPYGMNNIELNKVISVETEQSKIESFKISTDNIKLESLNNLGDYHVVGKIDTIYYCEDNSIQCVDINVNDWNFTISYEDINTDKLNIGDVVQFDLFELKLFDDGIY